MAENAAPETEGWQPKHRRAKCPTVLQLEGVECGAAALAILMGRYKHYVPLEKLRIECGVSRDGSKALNIAQAARNRNFDAKGWKKDLEGLDSVKVPFIVFWNFNHFLVVEGFGKDVVYLNDPAMGPRRVTYEEFDLCYTGVVLEITPGEGFKREGSPPNIVAALRKRMKKNYRSLLFLLLVGLALVIPGLLVPVFSKVFVDNYLVDGLHSWLRPLLIGMGITALGRGLFTWLQSYYLTRFESKLNLRDSAKFFWHLLLLPIQFYAQRSAGDLSGRVMLNNQVASVIAKDVVKSALDIAMIIFYLTLMLLYNIPLALLSVLFAAINFLIIIKVVRVQRDKSIQIGLNQGQLLGTAMNGLVSIETLKASGRENDFFAKVAGIEVKIVNATQELQTKTATVGMFPMLLSSINTALILGLGGYFVIQGHMTVGMLVAFQSLSQSFSAPIGSLVGIIGTVKQLSGNMNKIDDVLKNEPVKDVGAFIEDEQKLREASKKLSGYVELNKVTFGYNPVMPALIEDFSLSLKPGQRIAIVGGSGSGKSTVVKLICNLYAPWSGELYIDKREISSIPNSELYSTVSLVDQDITLFEGTIRDNLTMWDKTIPEEDMIQAAKDACIHDDITARSGGYDSVVTEGGNNFSGGQRQRLEIARALANNPNVLLLDEATSALDPITENTIDNNIRRRGCTCIIVAHRLSTIRDAEEIIVLSDGEIAERGNHESLIAQNGLYAKLVKMIEQTDE